jgi:hypothetical protein
MQRLQEVIREEIRTMQAKERLKAERVGFQHLLAGLDEEIISRVLLSDDFEADRRTQGGGTAKVVSGKPTRCRQVKSGLHISTPHEFFTSFRSFLNHIHLHSFCLLPDI